MAKKKKRIKIDNPDSELIESIHDLLDSIQLNDTFGILKGTVKMYGKLAKSTKLDSRKKELVIEVVTEERDFKRSERAKEV